MAKKHTADGSVAGMPKKEFERELAVLQLELVKAPSSGSRHLLSLVPCEDVERPPIELPPRQTDPGYRRPPKDSLNWIPTPY